MPYAAVVYKVMIASPGDVTKEREIIRSVVNDWNAAHSEHHGIVLLPVGWDSHAAPEMGDRPQEIINRQILRDCDLLIAVFWTRLGTSTGKAPSGTVEEIEEHVAAGKVAMLYFSNTPVAPNSVDQEQLAAVASFRDECRKRGIYEGYDSHEEFRQKLTRQLAIKVNEQFPGSESVAESPGDSGHATLSTEAATLLCAAVEDRHGQILTTRTSSGYAVQTGGKNFVPDKSPKSEAIWKAALDELWQLGLIEATGYQGEVFRVTRTGFDVAEHIQKQG